jgi:hypothetical protein
MALIEGGWNPLWRRNPEAEARSKCGQGLSGRGRREPLGSEFPRIGLLPSNDSAWSVIYHYQIDDQMRAFRDMKDIVEEGLIKTLLWYYPGFHL